MPTDALWVAGEGISYTDEEDRKLIHAIFADGRVEGLELSVSSGLTVRVAPGSAVIRDHTGKGSYLATLTVAETDAVPANATNIAVYLVVNPITAEVTVQAGPSVPEDPFYVLGAATTGGSTVLSVNNANRVLSDFTPAVGRFLKRSGDTVSGALNLDSNGSIASPSSFLLDKDGIRAQKGVRLGSAAEHTKRYLSRHERSVSQNIVTGDWASIDFDDLPVRAFNDYSTANNDTYAGSTWTVPVSGFYAVSGRAFWDDIGGSTANGARESSIVVLNSAGAVTRRIFGQYFQDSTLSSITMSGSDWAHRNVTKTYLDQRMIWWEAGIDLLVGEKIELQVLQTQGSTIAVVAGATGLLRLLQAD